GPGDVAFLANPKYASALGRTRASAVILRPDAGTPSCAALRHDNPYLAFANALEIFARATRPAPGVHALAHVEPSAQIARHVSVAPCVYVGDGARIGDRTVVGPNTTIGAGTTIGTDCEIHSNVAIRERITIGDRVVLQNGVVIGSDGYG